MNLNCEILAPAGDEQSARAAIFAGADAIYLGLKEFSARASAENFGVSDLARIAEFAHVAGAKVYVALNTLVKDGETDAFFSLALSAWNAGVDAILIQDIFLGKKLKEIYPEMVLHLSTQAGCCNVYGALLAKENGFSRVVLARETPLSEIVKISAMIETEVFVQGALCTCFSGQCYLSSFAGNNSGNRGRCKQPCRKQYSIDRAGFSESAYALSLSDLCVGARAKELVAAGARSLKIEGRMRRPEYVAAAVSYYRELLSDGDGKQEFTRLKRAYNRGGYTHGLAFGQDKMLLSREVQGHIGEDVGTVSVKKDGYFCESAFAARAGDGFKILRGGREVGGAAFARSYGRGFYLSSSAKLLAGDRVRVTTDTAANAAALSVKNTRKIPLEITVKAGEKPCVVCGDFTYTGDFACEAAQRAPLTAAEIEACFMKTDGLPLSPECKAITEGAFVPRSQLNAFRRAFYGELVKRLAPPREKIEARAIPQKTIIPERGAKTAVIASDLKGLKADVLIFKPRDYADLSGAEEGEGEKFLYLPPLFTEEDEAFVSPALSRFRGIYCDGYYGVKFAEKYNLKLFAGTGFNLVNRYAVAGASEAGAEYFVLSKELSSAEQRALSGKGAFALTLGSVKVMDLCYCPFQKTCPACDKRELYALTDEGGREFPLRRYRLNGCRFEVYNCAPLAAYNGLSSALVEITAGKAGKELVPFAHNPENALPRLKGATKGHAERSLL